MKVTICRILQLLLLAVYAIGVFVIIFGVIGFAVELLALITKTEMPEYKTSLAHIGIGAILTYAARAAEKCLVVFAKPNNGNFIALLESPWLALFNRNGPRNTAPTRQ